MSVRTKTKYLLFSYRCSTVNEGNIFYKYSVRLCKETIALFNACSVVERYIIIRCLGLIVEENVNLKMRTNNLKKEKYYSNATKSYSAMT